MQKKQCHQAKLESTSKIAYQGACRRFIEQWACWLYDERNFFEGLMKALEGQNADSASLFRPMSARLEVIAHLNAQALTELDENTLGEFQEWVIH